VVRRGGVLSFYLRCRRRQHTSANFSIRQHTSAYVSIRQHTPAVSFRSTCVVGGVGAGASARYLPAYVSIRQHTSAYVSIRLHTSAYVSIRQHTSAVTAALRGTSCWGQQWTRGFLLLLLCLSMRDSLPLARLGRCKSFLTSCLPSPNPCHLHPPPLLPPLPHQPTCLHTAH
jgi:hypothetical protein